MIRNIHFGRDYGSLYRKTNMFIRECFKQWGITYAELIILALIQDNPGSIQDDVARNLAVDKAAVARSIKNLESFGLLTRTENSENQRMKKVYATPKADEYKAHFDKIMRRWNEIILSEFSPEEQEFVLDAFARMRRQAVDVDIASEVARLNNGVRL